MTGVIAEGAETVQTVMGGVAKAVTKRTVVSNTTVLGVPRGPLMAVGTFVFQAVNTKMPCNVTVKTTSLRSHCGFWAQTGVSRCNSSGIGGSTVLMKSRVRVSGDI